MSSSGLLKKLTLLTKRFSLAIADGKVGYCSSKGLSTLKGEPVDSRPIVILAKKTYQEHRQTYPVKSKKELLQLLQAKQPPHMKALYFIGPWKDNERQVLTFTIPAEHLEKLPKVRMLVPETLLLAKALDGGMVEIETPDGALFFWQNQALPKSDLYKTPFIYSSAAKGGVLRSAEAAKIAFGVNAETRITQITQGQYLALLRESWIKLPWEHTSQLLITQSTQREPAPVASMAIVASVVAALYFVASSAYLGMAERQRTAQLASFGPEVSERLSERSARESEIQKIAALSERSYNPDLVLASYDVLAKLQEQGTQLNDFAGDFSVIELRGEAPSATDLVIQLNTLPQISNVEFTAPVRRSQRGEALAIRIELHADWRERVQTSVPETERTEEPENG